MTAAVTGNANYILADEQLRAKVVDRGTLLHGPVSDANWQSMKGYAEARLHHEPLRSNNSVRSDVLVPKFRGKGVRFCHAGTAT
jgi:hypothetical protein